MKIFNVNQIRECDAFTIENEPIKSVDLMERAAKGLCKWIAKRYSKKSNFICFAGQGNNGGDVLALARLLSKKGFANIAVFLLAEEGKLSCDAKINYERLSSVQNVKVSFIDDYSNLPKIKKRDIVIDGIFGSGLSRPVEGNLAKVIQYINSSKAEVIAVDIPSGLFADSLSSDENIIRATHTLSFQFPKRTFFFAENEQFTGSWHIINIGLSKGFIKSEPTPFYYLQKKDISKILKERSVFSHKGTFGHALLVAGSYQKTGAAVLASKSCLRSGVGLLTVHVPHSSYAILQTAVPEAMLLIDNTQVEYCAKEQLSKFSAIGIGSGIGTSSEVCNAFKQLMINKPQPMVIDADAINLLSENMELQKLIPQNSILTPHPGEFDRLTHKHISGFERLQSQIKLSKELNVFIVLKGAFTSISTPNGEVYFNSTGNSGMATAGSGDVLTGIVLAMLSQGYSSLEASLLAVYLHGLSGDLALKRQSKQSLIASDIIDNLGQAFKKVYL